MKLKISPGWWLVYVSSIYFIAGMVGIFVYPFCGTELLQFTYCVILSLPLWIPPLSQWVGVKLLFQS
jgi:hypothetical protein